MLTLGEAIQALFSIPCDEVTLHRLRMAWLDERALRHLRDVPDGPHPSLIIQIAHPLGPRRGWGRVDCGCLCGLRTGDALTGTTVSTRYGARCFQEYGAVAADDGNAQS